ncbi:glyoxalase/bleomycin resistance/extradiol dioxygenase family protein [Mesorhizobium sp. DCY119]|jgi:PhnB protein|uniref:VOC family protein n=1 Tax=Mesorhizobium sp. DCY119 TaxID=2108445 RepID=UPI000E6D1F2F|nr:glyoxalase/bleomycin resistance/extradiol dioxygenase family protein [Mesorhizobium sp. DCY119]RJG44292.1 glyoxalase/bleomycin resistance/extradiol dioxygenase family protein [Mesorhizobium sp. DCY119]
MSEATAQTLEQPAPKVLGGLVAYLQVDGAMKVAEFYAKAFDARQVFAVPPDEQGRTMHVHLYINGSSLMLCDAYPEHGHPHQAPQGYTMQLLLETDTIDTWWDRAVKAGMEVVVPLDVMFWGDRWGQLRDPFGIHWAMNAPVKQA